MPPFTELPLLSAPEAAFTCPGEGQPISRSLHLARLAAGHPGCRLCTHRQETTGLPRFIAAQAQSRLARQAPPLITEQGIRGRYINQLTRENIGNLVQHLLELLAADRVQAFDRSARGGLKIVTGYDSRPHSPDLAIGVVAALKQWGCDIADLGHTTRPLLDAAVDQLRPDAGLFLTGGNAPHEWNGVDVIDHNGLPWCLPGRLGELQRSLSQPGSRTGRTAGRYEAIRLTTDYQHGLAHHFHAIRPLRLAVFCPNPLVRQYLKTELDQTSCSVLFSPIQVTGDRAQALLVETMCERRLDVGFLIGPDGRSCRIYDEGGHEFTVVETLNLLHQLALTSENTGPCWIARLPLPESADSQTGLLLDGTEADLLRAQKSQRIPLAGDAEFRFWFLEESPACDAIQTLARILEVLSLSDRPASSYRSPKARSRPTRAERPRP